MSFLKTDEGLVLKIIVKPNSPKFEIILNNDELLVYCTEKPVRGKVNKEIVQQFSKRFHVKTSIISGLTSKHKRLMVKGIEKTEAEKILAENNSLRYPAT